jgi:ParB family chromosome partitioning protein
MAIVAIAEVTIGTNRRPLREDRVVELMESIKMNGLLNPITIDANCKLVAGLHRLTACKLLGFEEIECRVLTHSDAEHARLAEIDENLIRSELDALERAELWLERDELLKRMGLRASTGDNQYTRRNRGGETVSPPQPKTTLELAKEAGFTDRTFQLGKQIARDIAPEVKQRIRGTDMARSTTTLLKVARAGSEARKQAAAAAQNPDDPQAQAQLKAAKAQQLEQQFVALHSAIAEKVAKETNRKKPSTTGTATTQSQLGDEWLLGSHYVYCGDTASPEFVVQLPSAAALAIAAPGADWQHDFLIDEARIVIVICRETEIYSFCRKSQMPFQYGVLIGGLYLAVFSHHSLPQPQRPSLEGIESTIAYLVSLYTKPGNFVIGTELGYGELLIACERLGRVCFIGDPYPQRVDYAIERWQQLTRKQAEKMTPST